MDGNALDIALALLRSPSKRFLFAHSPLPPDVSEVIFLAAAAPERLAQASERTGETEEKIIEAARFYVREVLLFDGADAYRLLGATPASDPSVIKTHHRALQQWLHPDRRGDEWESIYATRINAAWSELRSPQRRAMYDARARGERIDATPHRTLVRGWRAIPAHQPRAHEYVAIGIAVALLVGLLILLDHESNEPAPKWQPSGDVSPRVAVNEAMVAKPSLAVNAKPPVEPQLLPQSQSQSSLHSSPSQPQHPAQPQPLARALPLLNPANSIASVPATPPRLVAKQQTPMIAKATALMARAPAITPEPQRRAPPPAAQAPMALQPSTQPPVAIPAIASSSVTGAAAPAPRDTAAATVAPTVDLQRVSLAQRVGRDVTRYLSSSGSNVPPLWRNARALDAAANIRNRIVAGRSRGTGHARFGQPVWHIAQDHASMIARIDGAPAAAGAQQLRVELAWHDGMWLVDSIAAETQ